MNLFYPLNQKSGTCGNVCDTPLPKPDKYLLNTYLLNPIAGKDGIHFWIGLPILNKFLTVRVGRKSIRPSVYLAGGGVRPLRGRLEGVCNTPLPMPDKYLLNTYLLNPMLGKDGIRPWIGLPILAKFSTVRVGRKSIRSTNAHDKGQMIRLPGTFGCVCDTPLP